MNVKEHPILACTVNAATYRLGISRTTLYSLIRKGELRTFRLGGRTLIAEAELRQLVELSASASNNVKH